MENMEVLMSKLDGAETVDDVIRICAEQGVEITEEQLKQMAMEEAGELTEDALDTVAGGYLRPVRMDPKEIKRLMRKLGSLFRKMYPSLTI